MAHMWKKRQATQAQAVPSEAGTAPAASLFANSDPVATTAGTPMETDEKTGEEDEDADADADGDAEMASSGEDD